MAKKTKAPAAVAAPVNEEDALFNELVGSSSQAKEVEKKKKDETIPLTDAEGISLLENWAASSVASKVLGDQAKGDAAAFKQYAFSAFCKLWEKLGGKPTNPVFSTGTASGCLQVKSPVSLCVPKDSTVKAQLVEAGLPAKTADIFQGLVEETVELNIKPLHELRAGTNEERAAALALMRAVQSALTPEQRELVLVKDVYLSVDPEKFFNTVSVCKGAKEIETVFQVISPQLALSSPKHAEALAVTQHRLNEAKDAFEAAQAEKQKKSAKK